MMTTSARKNSQGTERSADLTANTRNQVGLERTPEKDVIGYALQQTVQDW